MSQCGLLLLILDVAVLKQSKTLSVADEPQKRLSDAEEPLLGGSEEEDVVQNEWQSIADLLSYSTPDMLLLLVAFAAGKSRTLAYLIFKPSPIEPLLWKRVKDWTAIETARLDHSNYTAYESILEPTERVQTTPRPGLITQ